MSGKECMIRILKVHLKTELFIDNSLMIILEITIKLNDFFYFYVLFFKFWYIFFNFYNSFSNKNIKKFVIILL